MTGKRDAAHEARGGHRPLEQERGSDLISFFDLLGSKMLKKLHYALVNAESSQNAYKHLRALLGFRNDVALLRLRRRGRPQDAIPKQFRSGFMLFDEALTEQFFGPRLHERLEQMHGKPRAFDAEDRPIALSGEESEQDIDAYELSILTLEYFA